MKVLQILNNIDRRIIYLLLSVVVMVPLILESKIDIVADPYSETAFNEIESEVSGKLIKVLVDDSTPVEFDQPLFLVDPS